MLNVITELSRNVDLLMARNTMRLVTKGKNILSIHSNTFILKKCHLALIRYFYGSVTLCIESLNHPWNNYVSNFMIYKTLNIHIHDT